MTEYTLRFVTGYNIPTVEDVLNLLSHYCVHELHCAGLSNGYVCPADCPVQIAKAILSGLKRR